MTINRDSEERFAMTFSDIMALFRRFKWRILSWAFVFATLGVLFALIKPIRYQAEGTFREKNMASGHSSSMAQALNLSNLMNNSDNEPISIMKSRKLLTSVIEKFHLQANLVAFSDLEGPATLMDYNWKIAKRSFLDKPEPVLPDICCPLKISELSYTGEIPLSFLIFLKEEGRYNVLDKNNPLKVIGEGTLGEPFHFQDLKITFIPTSDQPLTGQILLLDVDSLANTNKEILKFFQVDFVKNDKNLLKITFTHRDRQLAADFVNTIMEEYQAFLKEHHQKVAFKQLDYLNLRRDQLTQHLTGLMRNHADYLSKDLYGAGFIDSPREMEFLAHAQHDYKQKLLVNDLEIKRLESIEPSKYVYYDRYSDSEGHSLTINTTLTEIRNLKQHRDALEIDQQKKALKYGADLQRSFDQQLNELRDVQRDQEELKTIITHYEQGLEPPTHLQLFHDHRFLLKGWFDRLQRAQIDNQEDWQKAKESFQFYLTNLTRLLDVHEHILQERLTHHQNPSGEYQGVSLELATNLYLEYSRQVVELEGKIRQMLFFIHQMENPDFEITSLSAGLTDPVSSEMIRKASTLVLNLKDQNNQSAREQERIKTELQLQRTFLTMHLQQSVDLMELNKKLLDERIFALQNVSLELINQRVSLLDKNLQDYVQSRLHDLHQQRELMKKHLKSIYDEMAALPKKWMAEKLIDQELSTNRLIVEEIAKLVETKNISHNLEVMQSAPVDVALAPVHPVTPRIFFLGFLGFMFGGVLGSGLAISKTIRRGIEASLDNLKLMGYHVSGKLIPPLYEKGSQQLRSDNLETLRRLQAYVDTPLLAEKSQAQFLLLLEGKGPHYAPDIADLFLKRGRRVLTIDLDFKQSQAEMTPGLLQYLQGEIKQPPIQKDEHGDKISAGGASPFVMELMSSAAFQALLEQLKPNYDWILIASRAFPCSAEAEGLAPLFPFIGVTLQSEKIEELNFYYQLVEQGSHKLSFILASEKGWT